MRRRKTFPPMEVQQSPLPRSGSKRFESNLFLPGGSLPRREAAGVGFRPKCPLAKDVGRGAAQPLGCRLGGRRDGDDHRWPAAVRRPVVAGVLLGLAGSSVFWFLPAPGQETASFFLLAGFLLLRPQGLFGWTTRLEAEA